MPRRPASFGSESTIDVRSATVFRCEPSAARLSMMPGCWTT